MDAVFLLVMGLAPIAALLAGMNWAKSREAAVYNGGFCTECPGSPMVRFDTDSQGGRGYRCDNCQRRIWVSYGVDR